MTGEDTVGDARMGQHATGEPHAVAPSKPAAPRAPLRPPAPVPVEVTVGGEEVISPVPPPPADEVMPEARSPFDGPPLDPEPTPPAGERPTDGTSAVQLLGEGAAANAALHASGAPTPLGGVPRVMPRNGTGAAARPHPSTEVDDAQPSVFVPRFAMDASAPDRGNDAGGLDATAILPTAAWVGAAAQASGMDTGRAAYAPRMMSQGSTPVATAVGFAPVGIGGDAATDSSDAGGATGGLPPADQDGHGPRGERSGRDRAWPLVLAGLVSLGAILAAAAWLLLRPETIEIPAATVVIPPAERAVEPYVPENPTPFLAAMPATSGAWTLTGVTTPDPARDTALPDRVTEVQVLTYSDGEAEVTLTARQLYTPRDARRALVRAVGKDVVLEDATVGSTVVGDRAVTETESGTVIRWTNGAALFEAAGEPGDVETFVALLGL